MKKIFIDNFSKFPPNCHLSCLVNRGEEESEDHHDHEALHSGPQHCLYLTEQASQQFVLWTSDHCVRVLQVLSFIRISSPEPSEDHELTDMISALQQRFYNTD